MDRSSKGNGKFAGQIHSRPSWLYDAEPYTRIRHETFDMVIADQRLKRSLKKAVAGINAPAHLIDAIRREIRK